jgi:hypothetical protein
VDPQDYQRLSKYNWHVVTAPNTCYAARSQTCKLTGQSKNIPMHRSIITIPDGMLCDHINHIGLDNRSANLRPATAAQNSWNRKKQSRPTSSKYKGVYQTISNTWSAKITVLGKRIHLGTFKSESAAAKAYDLAAKTHFGRFAYTNFSHNKYPILNHILTPVKALPQLLFLFCCMLITLLRTIKPLIHRIYPALITAFAALLAFQSPISIFLLFCFFSSFPPFALIFPYELQTSSYFVAILMKNTFSQAKNSSNCYNYLPLNNLQNYQIL